MTQILNRTYSSEKSSSNIASIHSSRKNESYPSMDKHTANTACQIYSRIDWNKVHSLARICAWKQDRKNNLFSIQDNASCILAKKNIRCSVSELRNALRETATERYNDTTSAIFGVQHAYEFIVQKGQVHIQNDGSQEPTNEGIHGELQSQCSVSDYAKGVSRNCDVYLKKVSTIKRSVLSRTQQWNQMELTYNDLENSGFYQLYTSITSDLTIAARQPKTTITSVIGGLSVHETTNPLSEGCVELLLYAETLPETPTSLYKSYSILPNKSAHRRLENMTETLNRIGDLLCRRRLGAQVLANIHLQPQNRHCNSCIKPLTIMSKKKRCRLCAYLTCEKCSTVQTLQKYQHRVPNVRICKDCMDRVNSSNYDHVTVNDLVSPRILPSPKDAPSTAVTLTKLLEHAFATGDEEKKRYTMAVAQHLCHEIREQTKDHCLMSESDDESSLRDTIQSEQSVLEYIRDSDLIEGECVLGSSTSRSYPLKYANATDKIPISPVVADENERLAVIAKYKLAQLKEVDELLIICEIAARELNALAAFVTIVTHDTQYVICSNLKSAHQTSMARTEAVCPHLIMEKKPLLIPRTQTDVRLFDLHLMKNEKFDFYFGHPLYVSGHIVGSLCCLDKKSVTVNATQYHTLARLAGSAARVLDLKGKAACQ